MVLVSTKTTNHNSKRDGGGERDIPLSAQLIVEWNSII